MSNETREQAIERASALLSEREAHAYRIWCGSAKPALAPTLNAKLFALYLNGKDCEEIRRLNQQYSLGEIVAAKVQGDWDRRRQEHLDRLLAVTAERVQQAGAETIDLICDMLAVANREHGDKLRRYLQSGDERDLGDFRIASLPALKMAIESLQKLTGQEQQKVVKVSGQVTHTEAPAPKSVPTAAEAAGGLKLLLGKKG